MIGKSHKQKFIRNTTLGRWIEGPVEKVPIALLGQSLREKEINEERTTGKRGAMVEWHGRDGWTDGKEGIKKGHRTMTEQRGQHKRKDIEVKGSEALFFIVLSCLL